MRRPSSSRRLKSSIHALKHGLELRHLHSRRLRRGRRTGCPVTQVSLRAAAAGRSRLCLHYRAARRTASRPVCHR